MTARHDIDDIINRIDGVLEVATVDDSSEVTQVTSTARANIARPLAETAGLDTIVVARDESATDLENATAAARAAAEAFLPGFILEALRRDEQQQGDK